MGNFFFDNYLIDIIRYSSFYRCKTKTLTFFKSVLLFKKIFVTLNYIAINFLRTDKKIVLG